MGCDDGIGVAEKSHFLGVAVMVKGVISGGGGGDINYQLHG